MSFRSLGILAVFVVGYSISSPAQSLGDIARQFRAERQHSTTSRARIITNDDIASSEQGSALLKQESQDGDRNEGEVTAPAANQGTDAGAGTAEPKNAKSGKARKDDPAKERELQEIETQKRTNEINQIYLDRIATLRAQINTAQSELEKLQRDRVESTTAYQVTVGASPNLGTYEQQQRLLIEQMEAHRDLIHRLNSQLEDAEESARHAGVRHASD